MLIFPRTLHRLYLATAVFLSACSPMQTLAQADPASSESSTESGAASSSQTSEKPIYGSTSERDNELLAKAFAAIAKADEIQWLETPDEKIVSLFKPGEEQKVKGALLILHAPETPQLWPAPLENLRRNLPIYGWTTMAVPLPAKYAQAIPPRESPLVASETTDASASSDAESSAANSSASSSAEAEKPLPPRSQLIAGRVEAARVQLNNAGQAKFVMLVDNSSAPDAVASLYSKDAGATADTGPLQALILVNLQSQEPMSKEQLAAIFSAGNLPVLDVFFTADSSELTELRRTHRAQAMRQKLKYYQQLILPPEQQVTIDDTQSFWLGKVRGFMEHKMPSDEAKQADK